MRKNSIINHQGNYIALGFSSWKEDFVPDFLGGRSTVEFVDNAEDIHTASAENVLVWSSKLTNDISENCISTGKKLWLMEDGFVRSVGLGADLIRPLSLVIDSCGIYYDSTQPSDLEKILNLQFFDDDLIFSAKHLREKIVALKISKYNVGSHLRVPFPQDKLIILVPGQVESDASIVKGSPHVKTNEQLLRQVKDSYPDAFIIYKPHPDVVSCGRSGKLNSESEGLYDVLIDHVSIVELLDRVDEVHTMTSLTGFEALLRGVKVVTYGMPFYAGWGLTQDALQCPRRTRRLSIDQLVVGALILYPIYVDPKTGRVVDVEYAINILSKQSLFSIRSLLWKIKNIVRKLLLKLSRFL